MSSFFKRWKQGSKGFADSQEGGLLINIFFLIPVCVGLMGGGVERLVNRDYWLALVLLGFGFIQLFVLRASVKSYRVVKRLQREIKGD